MLHFKSFCSPRGPLAWLDPGAFGTLGVGGGFALGAKLCRPDSDIWIIYGDGSLGYSVAEFDTFTRHKVKEYYSKDFFSSYDFSSKYLIWTGKLQEKSLQMLINRFW